jgi:hypothetical protein
MDASVRRGSVSSSSACCKAGPSSNLRDESLGGHLPRDAEYKGRIVHGTNDSIKKNIRGHSEKHRHVTLSLPTFSVVSSGIHSKLGSIVTVQYSIGMGHISQGPIVQGTYHPRDAVSPLSNIPGMKLSGTHRSEGLSCQI